MTTRQRTAKTTTQRGYGTGHQRLRAALLAAFRDGTICHHCDKPMWRSQQLDLDHTPDRTGYRGLCHASCNRADGARRGNRKRGQQIRRTSRIW